MEGQGVGRLVCLSFGAVEPDPALGIVFGKIMRPLLFKEMYADMSRMEREVRESALDWVIVRPSTLTDDPASGRYILGIDRIPKGWRVPREDVAEFTSTSSTTTATSGELSSPPHNRYELLKTPSGRSSGNNPSRYSGE
jgi:hypothetical protein